MHNIFANIPPDLPEELVEVLSQSANLRIERIVSRGHASPNEVWYDQDENEFVIVLSGAARLRFADKVVEMQPGDWVDIPAHTKHRVDWTTNEQETVWLAVFHGPSRTDSP